MDQMDTLEAGLTAELEVERFNQELLAYVTMAGKNMVREVTKVSVVLLGKIQRRTPVLTSRLRNSFHIIVPGETDDYTYSDNLGRFWDGTIDEMSHAELSADLIGSVVGTNVPYALLIEAGHSRKAPAGMVAVSVAEMAGELEAAIELALAEEESFGS